uniref:RYamide n=1 Tax=Carausius morosus TaxID=7022 RepID=A0A6G4ZU64_CARMO|nr:RYamide [Carausius morosus]
MPRPESVWAVGLVSVLALAVLLASAQQFQDNSRYAKRDEVAVPARGGSHVWSSRYGRSGNHAEVTLRNDRFFLGSRYGKRSDPQETGADEIEVSSPLACLYTGVTNLYRCFDRKDNTSEDFPSPQN